MAEDMYSNCPLPGASVSTRIDQCCLCDINENSLKRRKVSENLIKVINPDLRSFILTKRSTINPSATLKVCKRCYSTWYNSQSQHNCPSHSSLASPISAPLHSTDSSPVVPINSPSDVNEFSDSNEHSQSNPGTDSEQDSTSDPETYPESDPEPDFESDPESDESDSESDLESDEEDESDHEPENETRETNHDIGRSISGHTSCIFRCQPAVQLKDVPYKKRLDAIININIYIPKRARCCAVHLTDATDWSLIENSRRKLTLEEAIDAIKMQNQLIKKEMGHMKMPSLTESNNKWFKLWTGLNVSQFLDLAERSNIVEADRVKLCIFLIKLRKGYPNEDIGSMFGKSEVTVRRWIKAIRVKITQNFVPNYVGIDCITRERAIQNIGPIARAICADGDQDKLVTIWDGSYTYHQKSINIGFQKRSYSVQKGRPLIKHMLCVSPNGYILDCIPEHAACDNDASILNSIFSSQDAVRNYFNRGDVFVLDRGFRDSKNYLEQQGYKVIMPKFLERGQKQLSWKDANESRIATKHRWVIEAVNGKMKTCFRYLDGTLQNTSLPKSTETLKICAALYNAYHPRLYSDQGSEEFIIERFNRLINSENKLHFFLDQSGILRKTTSFSTFTGDIPELTEQQLYRITLGSYQLKYCASYLDASSSPHLQISEYTGTNFSREILAANGIAASQPLLLRSLIVSRHKSRTTYKVFVLIDKELSDESSIIGWTCQCNSGLRTLGCCTHVATVIWYLSYGKYHPEVRCGRALHLDAFATRLQDSRANNDST